MHLGNQCGFNVQTVKKRNSPSVAAKIEIRQGFLASNNRRYHEDFPLTRSWWCWRKNNYWRSPHSVPISTHHILPNTVSRFWMDRLFFFGGILPGDARTGYQLGVCKCQIFHSLAFSGDPIPSLGILAHLLRMVMEAKYLALRRWLYTPIIIWQGDWIPRAYVWKSELEKNQSRFHFLERNDYWYWCHLCM